MNINELGEDLEQQFGKPRNITEENVRFMLSLIKEEFDGTKVNENVEKPSLEAFGMTILAVMSYQTTPWEELAKKPSIRKTLKYIAIRGNDHYDEMEALTKELIRKHFDGITQKMVLGFLKIIRGVSNEERPTKLFTAFKHTSTEADNRQHTANGEAYTNGNYYQHPEDGVPPLRADGFLNVNFHIAKLLK